LSRLSTDSAVPPAGGEPSSPVSATDADQLKRQRLRSVSFLCAWIALAAWSGYLLATAWPYEMLRPVYGLFVALPGVVFRILDLAHMRFRASRLAGWRRALARVVALPIGLSAVPLDMLDRVSMARFEQAMAPLIAQVRAGARALCAPGAAFSVSPALRDYLEASDAPRRPADLHHAEGRFVLELLGGSADFDGSTVYFDSRTGAWKKFHNDAREKRDAFTALVKGMETCKVGLR
jgi:hypothetical protein